MCLELNEYLAQLPKATYIGDILTLTGESITAQALGCREYLARFFPGTGWLLMDVLEAVLSTRKPGKQLRKQFIERLLDGNSEQREEQYED